MANPQNNLRLLVGPYSSQTTNLNSFGHAWEDITSALRLSDGITANRGRQDERSDSSAGRMSFTLDNPDGDFTPDNTNSAFCDGTSADFSTRRAVRLIHATNANTWRINLSRNPSFGTNTTGWVASGAGAAAARITTDGFNDSACLRVTKAAAVNQGATTKSNMQEAVLPNVRYFVSAYVKVPTGQESGSFSITAGLYNSTTSGTLITSASSTPTVVTDADGWVRLSTSVISSDATVLSLAVTVEQTTAGTVGKTFLIDSVLIEPGVSLKAYFDGNSSGYAWFGGGTNNQVSYTPATNIWTGYIEDVVDGWASGIQPIARVTAADVLARLGARTLRSAITEEVLYDKFALHIPMSDDSGSTSAATVAPGYVTPASMANIGTGGTLTFGQASSLPWDTSEPCAVFSRLDASNGPYLRWSTGSASSITGPLGAADGTQLFSHLECYVYLPVAEAARVTVVEASDSLTGNSIGIEIVANSPQATIIRGGSKNNFTLSGTPLINDGAWHYLAWTVNWTTGNGTFTLDATQYSCGTSLSSSGTLRADQFSIGSTYQGSAATWVTSAINAWLYGASFTASSASPATSGLTTKHATYVTPSLSQETSLNRAKRVGRHAMGADWVTRQSAGTASATMQAQPWAGQSALSVMQSTADAELTPLATLPSGVVLSSTRNSRMTDPSPVTITAEQVSASTGFTQSAFGIVNDVTISRPGGAVVNSTDATSVDRYGRQEYSKTLHVTTDAQLTAQANYITNTRKDRQTRTGTIAVDLVTLDATVPFATTIAVDINSLIRVSDLPRGSVTSIDFFVEGISDSITANSWSRTWNTSPVLSGGQQWVLGSTEYGVLGSSTLLGT